MKSSESENSDKFSEEIDETTKYYTKSTDSFFSGGIDLVKWTATISSAAILWIATSIKSQCNPQGFSLLLLWAIIFFVASIVVAVTIVIFVQLYWANQIDKYGEMLDVFTAPRFYEVLGISPDHELAIGDRKKHFDAATKHIIAQNFFLRPTNFILLIVFHIALLVSALVCLLWYVIL